MPRRAADPLAVLAARRQISPSEYKAAVAYRRANDRRPAETVILRQCGTEGLGIVRAVIIGGRTIRDVSGTANVRERQAVAWFFRRSLAHLAMAFGRK
jgi:hypothetical protein